MPECNRNDNQMLQLHCGQLIKCYNLMFRCCGVFSTYLYCRISLYTYKQTNVNNNINCNKGRIISIFNVYSMARTSTGKYKSSLTCLLLCKVLVKPFQRTTTYYQESLVFTFETFKKVLSNVSWNNMCIKIIDCYHKKTIKNKTN